MQFIDESVSIIRIKYSSRVLYLCACFVSSVFSVLLNFCGFSVILYTSMYTVYTSIYMYMIPRFRRYRRDLHT